MPLVPSKYLSKWIKADKGDYFTNTYVPLRNLRIIFVWGSYEYLKRLEDKTGAIFLKFNLVKYQCAYGSWVKMKWIPLTSTTKRPQTFLDSINQNRTLCLVWYILKVLLLNGLKEDKQLLLHLHYLWNEVLMYTY